MHGENYWMYAGFDHDAAYSQGTKLLDGQVSGCYATFPTTRDPGATAHTAQILTWADPEEFAAWRTQPWLGRDAEYTRIKDRISDRNASQVARLDRTHRCPVCC